MTTVALEGMKFYAFHGFYDKEREIGNNYVLDVYCDIPQFDSIEDNILDTLNYENVFAICTEHMEKQYKLLESIALRIGDEIKAKFPQVQKVKVRVAKLNPPLNGMVDRAVIEYVV